MKVYALKDVVVGSFKSLLIFNNDNEAVRSMKFACNSVNDLTLNCDDLQLWCLGEYDVNTGVITSDVSMVANVIDFVNPEVYAFIKKPKLDNKEVVHNDTSSEARNEVN